MRGFVAVITRMVGVGVIAACYRDAPSPRQDRPLSAPIPPSCEVVGQHVREILDQRIDRADPGRGKRIAAAVSEECETQAWDAAARSCLANATKVPDDCRDRFTKVQLAAFTTTLATASRDPVAAPAMPEACIVYREAMDRYFDCMPAGTADSLRDAFSTSWLQLSSLDPDARASLGEACANAQAVIEEQIKALCP